MGAKILVVDDEPEVRTFLAKALGEMGGFSVEVAASANESLRKIEDSVFDLVLVDYRLPDMDGVQLISDILNSKPQVLTVLLTGHASIDSAVEAMKKGASDYLTKPVKIEELLLCLRRVMEEKKRFVTIRNYPLRCSFSWEKIKEMKESQTEFWAGDGLTRLKIVDIAEREGNIFMMSQDGKKTWPLRYQKLKDLHNKIHRREIILIAHEIDRQIPTWGNYLSGLLEFLGCDKVQM